MFLVTTSVEVNMAPTETSTLSRQVSYEMETGLGNFGFKAKTRPKLYISRKNNKKDDNDEHLFSDSSFF